MNKPHPFEALIERELADAKRVADEDDELMAAAARGEPFWGVGKAAVGPGQMRGLVDCSPRIVIERYAGATVDIPGGSIELGLQRAHGEPIGDKRAEMRRLCEEEALVLNGDDIDEVSAVLLSDRIDARFATKWPGLAWFIEIWNARERLTQVYHRWPLPM